MGVKSVNVHNLKEALTSAGIKLNHLNICGDGPPEGFFISKEKEVMKCDSEIGLSVKRYVATDIWWEVYYGERGLKSELKKHFDEASACKDFFDRLIDASKKAPKHFLANGD